MNEQIEDRIARRYSSILVDEIDLAGVAKIVAGDCHADDLVDSNQVAIDAFEDVLGRKYDIDSDEDEVLIWNAVNRAYSFKFYV